MALRHQQLFCSKDRLRKLGSEGLSWNMVLGARESRLRWLSMKMSILLLLLALLVAPLAGYAETKVVVLGTGTPILDYQRAGAGIAVIYNGRTYLFDVGGGVVRRAIEANQRLGIAPLNPTSIDRVFFTHLHSDHTLDFAE